MWALVIGLCHALGFASSIHAVMSTRTAQGAIAWLVSLNTFPYLALPAYWVLGRSRFRGYVVARRNIDARSAGIRRQVVEAIAPFRVDEPEREASRAAVALAGMPVLRGNRADLLIDGNATFGSIFDGIDRAESYLLVQFFIVKDDGLGRRLRERLSVKARAGVRVYFLYDEMGSRRLPASYLDGLRAAGVRVAPFNSRKGRGNRFQLNFRNHRKVVVADGKVAWIGGHNVGDEYLGEDEAIGRWRDCHVRIAGPAALTAQISFLEDWHWATDEVPDLSWEAHAAVDGSDSAVLVIPTGPADELETASLMFSHAIHSARRRVWIASPYFVPDSAIIGALQLAGLRGLDVRVLIPDNPDHLLVFLAAYSYFDDAGRTGVAFYRYTRGFSHQKAMLIDDHVATVGTANFDNRSFRLNFEITAVVSEPTFAAAVERMFERDFAHSRRMEAGEYGRKPWWFRVAVRLARLTAPIQ